jgi:hypothetical protein
LILSSDPQLWYPRQITLLFSYHPRSYRFHVSVIISILQRRHGPIQAQKNKVLEIHNQGSRLELEKTAGHLRLWRRQKMKPLRKYSAVSDYSKRVLRIKHCRQCRATARRVYVARLFRRRPVLECLSRPLAHLSNRRPVYQRRGSDNYGATARAEGKMPVAIPFPWSSRIIGEISARDRSPIELIPPMLQ